VTPSYNQADYLEETIRSVLLQGYPSLEYLVIDGGSEDASAQIIEKYAPWLTYWVSERDHGQAHAINKGWDRSTGERLGWINSDDTLLPGALQSVGRAHVDHPSTLILGHVVQTLEPDHEIRLITQQHVTLANMVQIWRSKMIWGQQGTFVPLALQRAIGPLDESLRYGFDRDWMCRLLQHASVLVIPDRMGLYRMHGSSKSVGEAGDWTPEQLVVTQRYRSLVPGLTARRAAAEIELCGALSQMSIVYRMNRRQAWRHIWRAVRQDPTILASRRALLLVAAALTPLPILRVARRLVPVNLGGW
jgi:glycosyltransferase involved in cell wall biosynthesis